MELYARNMLFLGYTARAQRHDICIHGKVVFKIGDKLLSDDTEWCVSASAYRFLQSLFANRFMGAEEFLIPCCGHVIIPSEDKTSVNIIGCNNGIDFSIIHSGEDIIIITADNTEHCVPFTDYKNAVLAFAKQVMDFYQSSPPREFYDDYDRDVYKAFLTAFGKLYEKGVALGNNVPQITPITFKTVHTCTQHDIVFISETGITLKAFGFINFKECAYNFKQTEGGSEKCVGERKITDCSFTFYTSPTPVTIKFVIKNKLTQLVPRQNNVAGFNKLQKQILGYGYSTRDMS